MRKRILRGVIYLVLALSIPAISWSLKGDDSTYTKRKTDSSKITDATGIPPVVSTIGTFDKYISSIYESTGLAASNLDYDVFKKALTGYYNFKTENLVSADRQIVSIVDFNKPSTEKRLWIVDLKAKKLLYNTFVAHGQGSGDNFATNFSNNSESHQSSLGFYITSETYQGKHGLSLRLNGMDKGYNTNALNRSVVVHGAPYVSQDFINQHGRLGRSFGCPAVPAALCPEIVNTIKGRTVLFINGPANAKFASNYLNEETAAVQFGGNQMLAGNI